MAANNPEEVAQAFIPHYYTTFDTNADGLAGLFNEKSMMTFEGTQIMGGPAVLQKVKSLGQVKHTPKTMDVQPSIDGTSIMIFVTGHIAIGDPNANPLHFSEYFHLVATGPGQYYIHNCMFRLNYGL